MDDTTIELIRLRHAVIAMRESMNLNLDAIESTIENLMPKEQSYTPRRKWDAKSLRALYQHTKNRTKGGKK